MKYHISTTAFRVVNDTAFNEFISKYNLVYRTVHHIKTHPTDTRDWYLIDSYTDDVSNLDGMRAYLKAIIDNDFGVNFTLSQTFTII
ncbi:hypothetical protein [Caudoviricetes sp.]|nr:hypothetical protein [Caudoviricetes sp.]